MRHPITVAVLLLALTACTTGTASPTAAGAGPVRLAAPLGRVELPEAADRVVALEWVYAEELVSLGITPVGVADVEGYAASAPAEPLPAGVADVGTRPDPRLDAIGALDPDLVIGSTVRHGDLLPELDAIAPTALFDPHPTATTRLEEMAATFRVVGAAVGRREDAERVLVEMEAVFAAARGRLDGLEQRDVVLAEGVRDAGSPVLRPLPDAALAVQVLGEIGLANAWDGPGGATVGPAQLAAVEDATLLHRVPPGDDVVADLAGDPAWEGLAFVRDGRVHAVAVGQWPLGGPASAIALVEDVSTALGRRSARPG